MPALTTIKVRRGTEAQWNSADPVLAAGEIGLESDTNKFKFGDGSTLWSNLAYAGGGEGAETVEWVNVLNKPTVSVNDDNVDGGSADAWYTWKDLKIDNSDANAVILDGVYVDGGSAVL